MRAFATPLIYAVLSLSLPLQSCATVTPKASSADPAAASGPAASSAKKRKYESAPGRLNQDSSQSKADAPIATRLFLSHDFVRRHTAPDFWALMPYYLPQQDGRSCSVASVAMLVNAARADRVLGADEKLVTQASLLETVGDKRWKKDVGEGGHGVTLDELATFVGESLDKYGAPARVHAVHMQDSPPARAKLHELLVHNEKSARDFILINFAQGAATGDTEGGGHIAPIAAYDEKEHRVLVMDPDREWYEPYWISEDTLVRGMATADKESGKSRGYVYVQLGDR